MTELPCAALRRPNAAASLHPLTGAAVQDRTAEAWRLCFENVGLPVGRGRHGVACPCGQTRNLLAHG